MATKTVVISDLTGNVIEEDDHVSIIVKDHPSIEASVRLDAGGTEIEALEGTQADFVVLELHKQSGTETMVIELKKFDKLFSSDPQEALEAAERYNEAPAPRRGRPRGTSAPRSTGTAKARRDPEQLKAIREWARGNGWPDLGDRGRIPAEAETAYNSAH